MIETTLQRLLKYPHAAVFDKDPLAELAIRVRHDDGCTWSVAAGVLEVTAGAAEHVYQLTDFTVAQLSDRLELDGFQVVRVNSGYGHLSALALVEGANDQWQSNGDHLRVFTSLMWALFQGYSREIDAAQEQVRQALLQMVITTAEGEWLDLWGTLYGVPRIAGESDADLRLRIPREAFRLRVNPRAIELAIKELTGKAVAIREPWQDVFTLDQSLLSGPDRLQDGDLVGSFLIQPQSAGPIDWADVLPIIERSRPAGVLMLPPQVRYSEHVVAGIVGTVGVSIKRRNTGFARYEDLALLDAALIEDVSLPNYPLLHRRTIYRRESARFEGGAPWSDTPWQPVPWNQAAYSGYTILSSSYRVFYSAGAYGPTGEYQAVPWQPDPWGETNTIIGASYTRTSS